MLFLSQPSVSKVEETINVKGKAADISNRALPKWVYFCVISQKRKDYYASKEGFFIGNSNTRFDILKRLRMLILL